MKEQNPTSAHLAPGESRGVHMGIVRFILVFGVLALILGLAFAAPVLAANYVSPIEQGTVPAPPPVDTGSSDKDDDDDDAPVATSTPAPVAGTSAQQMSQQQAGSSAAMTATPAAYRGVVLSPRLNVRSGPGTTYATLGQYQQDQGVTVQYRDATGDWWYTCCITGTTTGGWSSAAFIRTDFATEEGLTLLPLYPNVESFATSTPSASLATPRAITGDLTAVVNAQPRLLVRDVDGVSGEIVGRISDSATVEVVARNAVGDWWYVCCVDGTMTEGWVNASFLVPNFDVAQANTLIPLFGEESPVLQLPTPTPTPAQLSLPVITKMPKIVQQAQSTPTPVTVEVPTAAPTATEVAPPTPTPAPTTSGAVPSDAATTLSSSTLLQAVAWQEPAFAAPGDTVLLRYLITNTGTETAREVQVRNELPSALVLDQGAGSPAAYFDQQSTETGATVYSLLWESVPAGESVSATVAVTLAPDVSHGSVIYNLAAVGASNAEAQTATITISTPPAGLPLFQ